MPRVPCEGQGGGKDSVTGEPAVSSSSPPCHLLELLLSEADLPAALHSTETNTLKANREGRRPVPDTLGAGRERPGLPRPSLRLRGEEGRARPRSAPRPARPGMASRNAEPGPSS